MNPSMLGQFLEVCIAANEPVLVVGSPGLGKTDIIKGAAAAAGADLLIAHPVVADPTDFKGLPYAENGEAHFLPYGDLNKLIQATKKTVFFLDDLGQAPPSVQAACMQLVLGGSINGKHISPLVTFVAATNRKQDRAGVSGVLEPVKSRFVIANLEADVPQWCKWALGAGLPAALVAFIRFRPELLNEFVPTADISNSPCPRTVAAVGRLMALGLDSELEFEAYSGAVGKGFAGEFLAFLRIFRSLPNPDVVLLNPGSADVPTEPATLYALCGALARKASASTAGRLLTYANRLPDEFSVLLVRDALEVSKDVSGCREFVSWASAHDSVLV